MAVPAAPVPVAAAGDNSATITWPDVTATPAVTKYEYRKGTSGGWETGVSPLTLTGLANGKQYTVQVRAVNADGNSTAGSVNVTPVDADATNDNGFDDASWAANPGAPVPNLDFADPDD